MRDNYILTAESVTEGHPDKLCDAIADRVLDACLKHDPAAHVACEAMATAGKIIVAGEITARRLPDIPAIVCRTVRETGYSCDYEVEAVTHDQSGDIAGAVSGSSEMGAGDQGIMYGFACTETLQLLPLPVVLAHRLTLTLTNARKLGTIQGLGPDGKAQVSVEYHKGRPERIAAVVVSCQHDVVGTSSISLAPPQAAGLAHYAVPPLPTKSERLCGGPFRSYPWGPRRDPAERLRRGEEEGMERAESLPKAGTQQSGISSDEARYVAKNIVAAGLAERCTVGLAYAIGRAEPVAVDMDLHETGQYPEAVLEQAVRQVFDLTPGGIIRALGLNQPIFASFCNYGHFTHQDAPWEQTDRAAALAEACEREAR